MTHDSIECFISSRIEIQASKKKKKKDRKVYLLMKTKEISRPNKIKHNFQLYRITKIRKKLMKSTSRIAGNSNKKNNSGSSR